MPKEQKQIDRPHARARVEHETVFLPALNKRLAALDEGIARESSAMAEAQKESAKQAEAAVSGDRKALQRQTELKARAAEHRQQIQNLETIAAPIRADYDQAVAAIPRFQLAEQIELAEILRAAIPPVIAAVSTSFEPVSKLLAEAREQMKASYEALPLLGDISRTETLEKSLRTVLVVGLRSELVKTFGELAGFDLRFENVEGMQAVVGRSLDQLGAALQSRLSSLLPKPMTGFVRVTIRQNIRNLRNYGLAVSIGEVMDLRDDEFLRTMLSGGTAELVDAGIEVGQ